MCISFTVFFFEIWLNWKSVRMFSLGARSIVFWLQLNASCSYKSVVNMTQFSFTWIISQKSLIHFFYNSIINQHSKHPRPVFLIFWCSASLSFMCTQNVYILSIFLCVYCCRFDLFCWNSANFLQKNVFLLLLFCFFFF